MDDILNIIISLLPEVFMTIITLFFGVLYKGVKNVKKQLTTIKRIFKYILRDNIVNTYKDSMKMGYCSVERRSRCVENYKNYQDLDGNGGIDKIMEEIHALPTFKVSKKEETNADKLESETKK